MKSFTTAAFHKLLASLPTEVQEQARAAYRMFLVNPRHPGLHFKRVHGSENLVSARVSGSYRVVGVLSQSDEVVWFWIGPHEEYEKILRMR